jgi:carbonic anhydrase/acetyltransferase-like protein (isoleucine patch superfamily)
MNKQNCLIPLMWVAMAGSLLAAEHDYFKYLRYPKGLVPGVGVDKVEQEGGPNADGYQRRTVEWWPRKGQDVVDIPEGVPLHTLTRNKGQEDQEALAGLSRHWASSDPETFQAHLIGFRGVGTSTTWPKNPRSPKIPAAILRMENGKPRAVINAEPISNMVGVEDHQFIYQTWEKAYPKVAAMVSQDDAASGHDFATKRWTDVAPKFGGMELPKDSKYPRWGERGDEIVFETKHFSLIANPKNWGIPGAWINPNNIEEQNRYRKYVMEFVENFWTYTEAAGASMPYWRRADENRKYQIHIWASRCAGGWGHCGIGNADTVALGHEFFHGQPLGGFGWEAETMCNAAQHAAHPDQLAMFDGNFQYPWRNVSFKPYGASLWYFALSDNPNWGHGIPIMLGCLASPEDHTGYHAVARLGQKKGLWENGVRGFGDFFGEYAARMVTCDFIEQYMLQSKYGLPELSHVYPVYGRPNCYRISNAEAPVWCGFNIVRLQPAQDAKEIAVDFQGIHEPALHSDWRACIVAVDGNGQARYSPLWNKGPMRFALKDSDAHLWLTVSASPSAFPVTKSNTQLYLDTYLQGIRAPQHPWEVTLTGCRPGAPHRRQGDVVNFDDLCARVDYRNTFLNYPVKWEAPIPLTEKYGPLAQEKLTAMQPRVETATKALQDKITTGKESKGYWSIKKNNMLADLARRVKFLQDNAKGSPHPNGGGFVAESARVAKTAYVGPNAMVLDGARVEDNACIKESAIVLGPKTVISGNAKVGGRAWVLGDIKVSGNARILEAATVTTTYREPFTRGRQCEGQAEITGNAVIKGEQYLILAYATNQVITGGVVVDYNASIDNKESGVFQHGRFYQHDFRRGAALSAGQDEGALYANWQFNQPKAVLLEDSYVNNDGVLYGKPEFADEGEHKCIVFNGKDQYAEAPPSVADFGELTIDMMLNRSADGRLFDFGTGEEECFYLALEGGKPTLAARHAGKSQSLAASEAIPANQWARVRVTMDGAKASIHIDGKQVANGTFAFSPRDVFPGDLPEGNFIACGRNKKEFFKGKIDHFRIYRKVHTDMEALGLPPLAVTQVQEWSEKDQQLADDWDARRKAKYEELRAGEHGKMQQELQKLREQKATLQKTAKPDELANFDARITKLQNESNVLLENALKSAGLFGENPYPGKSAATIRELQQNVKYHTAADWDYKVQGDGGFHENEAPQKMKDWLLRVRGY